MKTIFKYALLATSIISLVCGIVCVAFIYYCELFGYDKGNNFLEKIRFPLNENGIIIVCFFCGVILFLSIFLRKRFF